MFRIDNATSTPVMPAVEVVGPNPDSYFTEGNPSTATEATTLSAGWLNTVQEELCYPIVQAGLTLDKADSTQLKNAMHVFARKETGIYAADSGSANAYVITLSPTPASYTTGMRVSVKITNTNTTTSTLNANSLGTKTIKLLDGNNLSAGDLLAGMIADFRYDGTNFQLLNPAGSWAKKSQIQSGEFVYATSTSAANTYIATLSPAITAYTTGMKLRIKFTNANTGAATLNVNGLGAVDLKRDDGSALVSGDIQAGAVVEFSHDGTNFRMQGTNIGQFAKSAANSGYQKFPSGIIIQWGRATLPNTSSSVSSVSIAFPIAFPNAIFSVTTSYNEIPNSAGGYGALATSARSVTTSGFNFYGDCASTGAAQQIVNNTVAVMWIAIGN